MLLLPERIALSDDQMDVLKKDIVAAMMKSLAPQTKELRDLATTVTRQLDKVGTSMTKTVAAVEGMGPEWCPLTGPRPPTPPHTGWNRGYAMSQGVPYWTRSPFFNYAKVTRLEAQGP